MRSDWDSAPVSEHEADGDEDATTEANTAANGDKDTPSRRWTIFNDEQDEKTHKERETADEHVHNYVQDQLKRLMSPDKPMSTEYEDEIEAKYDGM